MVKEYAFEGEKHYMNAVKAITDAVPSYSYFYDIAVSSISAKRAFDESGDVTVNGEVKKIYSSLSDEQKTWLTAFGNTVLCNKKKGRIYLFRTPYSTREARRPGTRRGSNRALCPLRRAF